jgi:hypothetical protein
MALLQLSSWYHCPHHNGIIAIINEQASLLLPQWRGCPCCASSIANIAWAMILLVVPPWLSLLR